MNKADARRAFEAQRDGLTVGYAAAVIGRAASTITVLETYAVNGVERAQRYWALQGRILVGGRIVSPADAEHLRALRVTHVLSAESEQDDPHVAGIQFGRFAFPDDGAAYSPPLDVIRGAVSFARTVLAEPSTVLYTHCRLGGSRGPSYAYLALRVLGRTSVEALDQCGRRQRYGDDLHATYVAVIEQALT